MFVLINAIYFKAKWKYPFEKRKTRSKLFYTEVKQSKRVQMMDLTNTFEFADLSSLQSTMLRLPYEGERIVLDILLPNRQKNLEDLEKSLEEVDIQSNFEEKKRPKKVHVNLPRFKIESEHKLNDILKSLGMTDMLNSRKADFTGMIPGAIYVDEVILSKLFSQNV